MKAFKKIRTNEFTVEKEVLHQIMRRAMPNGSPEAVSDEMKFKMALVAEKLAEATAGQDAFNQVFIIT